MQVECKPIFAPVKITLEYEAELTYLTNVLQAFIARHNTSKEHEEARFAEGFFIALMNRGR